jgi:hypothetical protein
MTNPEAIALAYLDSVATKDMDRCAALLAPNLAFKGPAARYVGAAEVLEAFRRISSIHVRNDIRKVFVDRDEVCVIYDFVTDTVGTLPTIEWLRIANGKIHSIDLFYDQVPWMKMREEMIRRAKATA